MQEKQGIGWEQSIAEYVVAKAVCKALFAPISIPQAADIALRCCQHQQLIELHTGDATEQGLQRHLPAHCTTLACLHHLPTRGIPILYSLHPRSLLRGPWQVPPLSP